MCTLVHHGILKVCLLLPQLSSLWPLSKLTVFHIILLSFKCNAVTAEADRMQFSKDLVSFPSLPGRLMWWSLCFLFALLLQEEQKKKKNRVLLDNLFGLAFGDGADWEDELTGWVEALLTTCVSNAFSCFLSTFYFYSFFTKMLHRCFSEMEITKSKPLYPKRAKPGLNTNDVWQST